MKKLSLLLSCLTSTILSLALLGCGGNPGADLAAFPAINKIEGDAPFVLTAPSSASPGAFSYSSSNSAVASIDGNSVTLLATGSTTITATQAALGKWGSSSINAILTVSARSCTAPATSQKGICSAPAMSGNIVSYGGRNWMPVAFIASWEDANTFCSSTTINGQTGWRLPDDFELTELAKNSVLTDQGWLLGKTWSSKAATASASRKTVHLPDGLVADELETNSAYFTCVK